jgi:cytochrome c553
MKKLFLILLVTMTALTMTCSTSRADTPSDDARAEKRQLFRDGAKLWPIYCAQCHNARTGSEFAPYQWNAILMHMRTQANLPARDARAILEYLKSSH